MEHLQRTGLIEEHFLPKVFTILRLYDGIPRAVRLDIWAVDEYYLDRESFVISCASILTFKVVYSSDSAISVSLLAAHLYYRALRLVPALIRGWLVDCRDRQLSTTVTTYTSTHFSPALLSAELSQVKDPAAAADLADENMKVKVAGAVHEITATYLIDEQELEIRLKLPSDWPLHSIEIKDSKRVGVTEDRWRSWILGVQQILTFRVSAIDCPCIVHACLTHKVPSERKHRRRASLLQEQCGVALRRAIRMCYLLLVRNFLCQCCMPDPRWCCL